MVRTSGGGSDKAATSDSDEKWRATPAGLNGNDERRRSRNTSSRPGKKTGSHSRTDELFGNYSGTTKWERAIANFLSRGSTELNESSVTPVFYETEQAGELFGYQFELNEGNGRNTSGNMTLYVLASSQNGEWQSFEGGDLEESLEEELDIDVVKDLNAYLEDLQESAGGELPVPKISDWSY